MSRVTCKDEGHTGGRVDREDAILVARKAGGNYRRAHGYTPTLICLGCAADMYARLQRGEFKGQLSHNRWSLSDLKHSFEAGIRRFAQRRGFEYGTAPVGAGGIHAPSEPEEEARDDSERRAAARHLRDVGQDLTEAEPGFFKDPAPRSYDELPVGSSFIPDTPNWKSVTYFEPKTEPSPDVPPEVAQEQAKLYEWVAAQVGIELTEEQKAEYLAREERARRRDQEVNGRFPHECVDSECPAFERIGRHTAHTSRPIERTPGGETLKFPTDERVVFPVVTRKDRMQVVSPDLQQMPHQSALAYGGLVPRKKGEFHHHFTSRSPMSKCVFCGKGVYDQCAGPDAEAWEVRMQERRDLKDRIFHLAYGVSRKGNREAKRTMAEFDAETLRRFPDRFREPTPEELKRREEFREMLAGLSKAPIVEVPLTEAEERYLAKARRQQDELNEHIRAAKEKAWDEGVEVGKTIANRKMADDVWGIPIPQNPYRKADDE